jgi:hypothetical protein
MKKSVKTYVLLTLVIGIWGVFLVRLVKTLNPEREVVISSPSLAYSPVHKRDGETKELQLDYRDPFLGKVVASKPKTTKKVIQKANKTVNTELDQVKYQGFIGAKERKDYHYFLTIKGTQEFFKVGDVIKGIKLVSGDRSQVTLRQNGVTKTIKISE